MLPNQPTFPLPVPTVIAAMLLSLSVNTAAAQGADSDSAGASRDAAAATVAPETWAWHTQFTNVTQGHRRFSSPYSSTNSLIADGRTEETTDLTLYAGLRLWPGAELWINPEIDQGFGLSSTVGVAGFPSGEAYKIGANAPYLRLPRLFVRHVIALDGPQEKVDGAANQLAGMRAANNVTLTFGKFSVVDLFDTNSYAHDPRADFMNWALIDAGSFDYAADAWGFTYGAAAEWTQGPWTTRAGLFQLSPVPNGKITGVDFSQKSLVLELEQRHQWRDHPGKFKLLGFINRGRMGSYADAVQLARESGAAPDTALVRRKSSNLGVALNIEQELAADLGVFARASANGGSKEAYEFTEINQSLAGGFALKGDRWGRHDDTWGVAAVVSTLSGEARDYFRAGGIGILIGDGALNYGAEKIVETYYSVGLNSHLKLALDYQYVSNPGHNRDRGPVSIFGARVHAEF